MKWSWDIKLLAGVNGVKIEMWWGRAVDQLVTKLTDISH